MYKEDSDTCAEKMTLVERKGGFYLGRNLFLREELSDVEILVETDRSTYRFPCLKFILSTASEVFSKMLNSEFSEGKTRKVTIKDISSDIVLLLLEYLYSGYVYLECWKTAVDVLQAAHKYEIVPLIKFSETYLSNNLTPSYVCFILDIALLYDLSDLKDECLDLCRNGGFIVLKTRAFTKLSASAVQEIICVKDLFVENKIDIFKAVWQWATMECCRKQIFLTERNIFDEFSKFAEYVGFQFLSEDELKSLPKSVSEYVCDKISKNVWIEEEKAEINESDDSTEADKKFSEILCSLINFQITIECVNFDPLHTPSSLGNRLSLLSFSVNPDVYLLSFIVKALNNEDTGIYFESFRLLSKDNYVDLWTTDYEGKMLMNDLSSSDSTYQSTEIHIFEFHAKKLILLESDVEYTIQVDPGNCEITWPSVLMDITRQSRNQDFDIKFNHYYDTLAVTEFTFIRAF